MTSQELKVAIGEIVILRSPFDECRKRIIDWFASRFGYNDATTLNFVCALIPLS